MSLCTILVKPAQGQRGMALISALLLLLVISLLAVGLSMDSSMDVRGAAYQRFKARAFGASESALMAASDILDENCLVDDAALWDVDAPFKFPRQSDQYVGVINMLQRGGMYLDKNPTEAVTMQMTGDIEAEIRTQYVDSVKGVGGGLTIADGYAGAGKTASEGGTYVIYNIESRGRDGAQGTEQATVDLAMNYRHVM